MNDNVTTFLANLRHDIRNNQTVEVGSGLFKGQELVDVADALAVIPELLAALQTLLPHVLHYAAAPAAHASAHKDAADARAAIAKAGGAS